MTTSDLKILSMNEINENLSRTSDWIVEDNGKSIIKNFDFSSFNGAVEFINEVAKVAEFEGHHPDLRLYGYKNVEVKLTTHAVSGLTQKDFDVAFGVDGIGWKE